MARAKPKRKRASRRPVRKSIPPCQTVDEPKKEQAPCTFCKTPCDKADSFCWGCKTVVCASCDVSCGNYGPGHLPEAHLIPFEEGMEDS